MDIEKRKKALRLAQLAGSVEGIRGTVATVQNLRDRHAPGDVVLQAWLEKVMIEAREQSSRIAGMAMEALNG